MWTVLVINALVWLRVVVPPRSPISRARFLDGSGMTTNPFYVQDLAFWLPGAAIVACRLWQRRPWGVVLAGAWLVYGLIEAIGVATDQWFGTMADPNWPAIASIEAMVLFIVVAAIQLVPLTAYFRPAGPPVPAGDAGSLRRAACLQHRLHLDEFLPLAVGREPGLRGPGARVRRPPAGFAQDRLDPVGSQVGEVAERLDAGRLQNALVPRPDALDDLEVVAAVGRVACARASPRYAPRCRPSRELAAARRARPAGPRAGSSSIGKSRRPPPRGRPGRPAGSAGRDRPVIVPSPRSSIAARASKSSRSMLGMRPPSWCRVVRTSASWSSSWS